jgi:hypothetical protein
MEKSNFTKLKINIIQQNKMTYITENHSLSGKRRKIILKTETKNHFLIAGKSTIFQTRTIAFSVNVVLKNMQIEKAQNKKQYLGYIQSNVKKHACTAHKTFTRQILNYDLTSLNTLTAKLQEFKNNFLNNSFIF